MDLLMASRLALPMEPPSCTTYEAEVVLAPTFSFFATPTPPATVTVPSDDVVESVVAVAATTPPELMVKASVSEALPIEPPSCTT